MFEQETTRKNVLHVAMLQIFSLSQIISSMVAEEGCWRPQPCLCDHGLVQSLCYVSSAVAAEHPFPPGSCPETIEI